MNSFHVSEIKEILSTPKRIAITMHAKADGDAIGSALGWYHYLKATGHRAEVVSPTDYPENLKWLPGTSDVMIGPSDPDRAAWIFEGADVIFCLDFNSLHRLNCLHVKPELNTAYILLNKEVFKTYNLKSGDTEGLVNYALSIDGIKLGVLISTQEDIVKFSMRSKHNVSASYLAQKFGGGGHFYAAGARLLGKIEEAEQRFLKLLEDEKDMLTAV